MMWGLLIIALPLLASGDEVRCGDVTCSNLQHCCVENGSAACCSKSSTAAIGTVLLVIVVVCLVSAGVGICLYLKNKVHKDTLYTVDDLSLIHI